MGFGELSEVKVESQLLSPTEKATFGLGAAHWGYGARVTAWEVRRVMLWVNNWIDKSGGFCSGCNRILTGLTDDPHSCPNERMPDRTTGDQHLPGGGAGGGHARGAGPAAAAGHGPRGAWVLMCG